jgi:hypothetical protein
MSPTMWRPVALREPSPALEPEGAIAVLEVSRARTHGV